MEKETKVKMKSVIIPVIDGDADTYVPVCINGFVYQVKKGEEVDVPEEVYFQLKNAGYLGIK